MKLLRQLNMFCLDERLRFIRYLGENGAVITSYSIHYTKLYEANSGRTSVILVAKKVSTQKKTKRLTARNTPMKMNAIGELKNDANSLAAMRKTVFIMYLV